MACESPIPINVLRRRVRAGEGRRVRDTVALGFAGAAIERGTLHECVAAEPEDGAAANAFALLLAFTAAGPGPILWLRADDAARRGGVVYAPGLVELGIDPARVMLTRAADTRALLRAAHEAARCGGVGAALVEAWGRAPEVDLNATRRLSLAAERSGVTLMLSRIGAGDTPSAARTRWRVAAAPSSPLEANAPGGAAFAVELLRDRGGRPPFAAHVEWDRDRLAFREAPLPRGVAAVPAFGTPARAA